MDMVFLIVPLLASIISFASLAFAVPRYLDRQVESLVDVIATLLVFVVPIACGFEGLNLFAFWLYEMGWSGSAWMVRFSWFEIIVGLVAIFYLVLLEYNMESIEELRSGQVSKITIQLPRDRPPLWAGYNRLLDVLYEVDKLWVIWPLWILFTGALIAISFILWLMEYDEKNR